VRLFWEARYLTLADWDWKDLPKLGVDLLRILPRAPEREIEWAGTTTSWASGYNWSDTAVPGPNTVVTINSAASDPMIDTTTNVNVLYVDVNSGSLNLSGTLDTFSMEVGPDGTLEFTDSDANITVFGDQRSQIISLIEEGRIYTDLTDKFVVPDYNDTDNSTVIKVIESVEEQVIDWNFNQTSGTDVPDNSGKGNDGSLISLDGGQLPSWAVGQGRTGESGDHAISFSGDPNSYVELLSGVDLPVESINAWTMNAWIYMDELPDDQNDSVFIAGMGRFGEPNVSSGKVRVLRDSPGDDPNVGIGFYGIDSSYYTQEPWDVDNWQMITITCDHLMNLKLYKNGHLIGTADLQLAGAEPIMRVGKGYLTGFSGMVDDFGIWSYEMSQKDIVTNLWGSWICGTENDNHPLGDFDGDCVVDMIDLALIADAWLEGYTTMDLKDIVDTWLESGRITGSEL
jgi:hypothetical protein